MGTITIKTIAVAGAPTKIEVTQAPGGKDGNLPVNRRASIAWRASSAGEVFRVYFFNLESPGNAFWPFEVTNNSGPDGYDAQNRPYLQVDNSAKPRQLKASAPQAIKYLIEAVYPAGVDPLDPVIIIRPAKSPNVALGVTCAVLGAIVGAAVCSMMS